MKFTRRLVKMENNQIDLSGLRVSIIDYSKLLNEIEFRVTRKDKTAITYGNAACAVAHKREEGYRTALEKFSIIHPDGIGVYLASRFLNPERAIRRMTGSDFYPVLIEKAIEKQWSIFIFGDKKETLEVIPLRYPRLRIVGMSAGYGFSENLSGEISLLKPDLILVGLGVPKQEKWISDHWEELPGAVYLAVGDGLKVLAGTKKRGGEWIQKSGFEWVVRLLSEPSRLWKRYLLNMPLFCFMVVLQKFQRKK